MKAVDVKTRTDISFNVERNYKDPKFEVDGHVRM